MRSLKINYFGPDHCTANGAHTLARRIRDYWAALGYRVTTQVYPLGEGFYGIRSDLVNGWPVARAA